MKNIGKIFLRDIRRLGRNAMAMIVAVGICIIPALYAWFNIAANWDPYGSTSGIQVAVANEDKGFVLEGLPLNIGDQIIENLKGNQQIGWRFVDSEAAIEGVKKGSYYAAVVIPADFSEKMASILSTQVEQPTIKYYLNEKKNAIAPKITDKGVGVIQQQVNSTFISAATEVVANLLNTATDKLEDQGSEPVNRLIDALNKADDNLKLLEDTVDAFSATADSVNKLVDAAKLTLPDAGELLEQGGSTAADFQGVITASRQAAGGITSALGQVMDAASGMLSSADSNLTGAFGELSADANAAADRLSPLIDQAQRIIEINDQMVSVLTDLNEKLPYPLTAVEKLTDRLNQFSERQRTFIQKLTEAQATIRGTGALPGEAQRELLALVSESRSELSGVKSQYLTEVKPQLEQSLDGVYKTLSDLSGLLLTAEGSLSNIDDILDGVGGALDSGKQALSSTKALISGARERIQGFVGELTSVGEDERLQKLIEIIRNDPAVMGSFLASPVQLETESFYPIENYGSAMAPFYSTLAFWVGGIVLVAILKVRVEEDDQIKRIKPGQAYLGRYLLFLLLGLIQSTIICLGDLYFLGVQCHNPLLFLLAGWVSSLVYTNIIYTLTVSFGDIGKALAVVLLVIQIAGAGGTFPIEVTPQFFQNVYPFLPFTYGINAMRETVAGLYGMDYWKDLAKLLCYVPLSLILGLVLRRPLIRLNEFFEERIEDTHLM